MESIAKRAIRRKWVFENLQYHLKGIKAVALKLDESAKVFIFGSVAKSGYLLSSDIDILIITDIAPEVVISSLWKEGFSDPFEFHVRNKQFAALYRKEYGLTEV
ncbi:Nucleotidyltransferase domain protein [Thermoplasmatales archaeon]|nr:Nucleotidyltransferase domain protein [Thermoplasmatales archaeon]